MTHPMPARAVEAAMVLLDEVGNPLCLGCHASPWQRAVLANSGWPRHCFCPPADGRLDEPATLAAARERIILAYDALLQATVDHALTCPCQACASVEVLRRGPK